MAPRPFATRLFVASFVEETDVAHDRAVEAIREVGRIHAFFPLLTRLGNLWAASRPWEGRRVALNLHLTTLTAALVRELTMGGGRWVVSAANRSTTDPSAVALLRQHGVEVFTGEDMQDRHDQVLGFRPELIVDVGFELIGRAIQSNASHVEGAIEITRSGISAMRSRPNIPFPIINLNDGKLKNAVENRHGVGEALWQAVCTTTGMHLSGRCATVVGYGPVGVGLASYARSAGMSVEVFDRDPVRRLFAHYDGYPTPPLEQALARAQFVVTATGAPHAITVDVLQGARDGVILANAGHGGDEIDVRGIEESATHKDNISRQVARYRLKTGRTATVLGGGQPLNIVLNSGSPEPVLLHFGLLGLTLEWLAEHAGDTDPGEHLVSEGLERRIAQLALESLGSTGLSHDG